MRMFFSVLLLFQGGVIGIKIGWVCDLDRADDQCNPSYSFTRLDAMSQKNAVSPGYNFRSLLQKCPSKVSVSVFGMFNWILLNLIKVRVATESLFKVTPFYCC